MLVQLPREPTSVVATGRVGHDMESSWVGWPRLGRRGWRWSIGPESFDVLSQVETIRQSTGDRRYQRQALVHRLRLPVTDEGLDETGPHSRDDDCPPFTWPHMDAGGLRPPLSLLRTLW